MSDILLWVAVACIVLFGSAHLGLSLPVVIFIIGMATLETTGLLIWRVFRPSYIYLNQVGSVRPHFSPQPVERNAWNGTDRKSGAFGTAVWESGKSRGSNGNDKSVRVNIADVLWRCLSASLEMLRNIALIPAKRLHIAHVKPLEEVASVWCLTVPDLHCWTLENGAIVHNSEHGSSAFRYLAVRQEVPREQQRQQWNTPIASHWSAI